MYDHEAARIFCKTIGVSDSEKISHDAAKMIANEAQNEIDRGTFHHQKNQYSKAVDVALERMLEWYNEGLEYHFETVHEFIASHRLACSWAVLLRRYHEIK